MRLSHVRGLFEKEYTYSGPAKYLKSKGRNWGVDLFVITPFFDTKYFIVFCLLARFNSLNGYLYTFYKDKKNKQTIFDYVDCLEPICAFSDTYFTQEYAIVDKTQTTIRHVLYNIKSLLKPAF